MASKTRLNLIALPGKRVGFMPKSKFVPLLSNLITKSVTGQVPSKAVVRRGGAKVINGTSRVKVVKR